MRLLLPLLAVVGLATAVPTNRDPIVDILTKGIHHELDSVRTTTGQNGKVKMTVCASIENPLPELTHACVIVKSEEAKDYRNGDKKVEDKKNCYEFKDVTSWTGSADILLLEGSPVKSLSELIAEGTHYGFGIVGEYYDAKTAHIVGCPNPGSKLITFNGGNVPTDLKSSCFDNIGCFFAEKDERVSYEPSTDPTYLCYKVGDVTTKHCQEKPINFRANTSNQVGAENKIVSITYEENTLELKEKTLQALLLSSKPGTNVYSPSTTCTPINSKVANSILKCDKNNDFRFGDTPSSYTACYTKDMIGYETTGTIQDLSVDSELLEVSGKKYFTVEFTHNENGPKYNLFVGTAQPTPTVDTTILDCNSPTQVKCYGFLNSKTSEGNTFRKFTIQYKDGTNSIHIPNPAEE